MVNLGTSLQLLLTQEIVRRQGEDTQEDSLTDTQVETSLQLLLTKEIYGQRQEEDSPEDSLTDTQVRPAFSLCIRRRLSRGRGRSASQILR